MADITTPMEAGDHVLAYACLVVRTARGLSPESDAMHREVLERALIKSTGQNPLIIRLKRAAGVWLLCQRDVVAMAELDIALHHWAEWRLGLSLETERAKV